MVFHLGFHSTKLVQKQEGGKGTVEYLYHCWIHQYTFVFCFLFKTEILEAETSKVTPRTETDHHDRFKYYIHPSHCIGSNSCSSQMPTCKMFHKAIKSARDCFALLHGSRTVRNTVKDYVLKKKRPQEEGGLSWKSLSKRVGTGWSGMKRSQ